MKSWFNLTLVKLFWLIAGLVPLRGFTAIVGKPKCGKSTFLRYLIVCIVKQLTCLDREVDSEQTHTVFYLHLDRKDSPARVASELRNLGITEEESSRIHLMVAEDIPQGSTKDRLAWLGEEVKKRKPTVIAVDVVPQLLCIGNINDYSETLSALNSLQDTLTQAGFTGAFIGVFHSRKASNADQIFDDVLGSSAIRGSFSNLIMLTQHRKSKLYTISSDQTEREAPWGELDENLITRNEDGKMELGRPITELQRSEKDAKHESDVCRLLTFLVQNQGSDTDRITSALSVSKATFLSLVKDAGELVYYRGTGTKGDPKLYHAKSEDSIMPQKQGGTHNAQCSTAAIN